MPCKNEAYIPYWTLTMTQRNDSMQMRKVLYSNDEDIKVGIANEALAEDIQVGDNVPCSLVEPKDPFGFFLVDKSRHIFQKK